MNVNVFISSADLVLGFVFTVLVARQYLARRKMHQLMWAIAIAMWTIATAAELLATLNGWSSLTYRAYYATGALLIPAWLGMGTLYLIFHNQWPNRILLVLTILSLLGIFLIAAWQIEESILIKSDAQFVPLKVFPFFPIQLLLIALNIFGTIAFAGGALWSAYKFARTRTMGDRVLATVLIGVGGFIAAGAHSLGVVSGIELFRVSELVALIVIFIGFLLSSPSPQKNSVAAPASNTSR
jgi:hypothetical protein